MISQWIRSREWEIGMQGKKIKEEFTIKKFYQSKEEILITITILIYDICKLLFSTPHISFNLSKQLSWSWSLYYLLTQNFIIEKSVL